jgi:antitoxin VapB
MALTLSTLLNQDASQVVRIPTEASFPDHVKKVVVRVRGCGRIITPLENTWDQFFLNGPSVSNDFMIERAL